MALDPVRNVAVFRVSSGYDETDLIVTLFSDPGDSLPDPSTEGAFNLIWWNDTDHPDVYSDSNFEIVRCTDRTGPVLDILRAQENTSASSKNISGKVYKMALVITKKMIDDIQNDLDLLQSRPSLVTFTAGEAVGGHRVVRIGNNERIYYADSSQLSHTNSIVGLTTGAISSGASGEVLVNGPITEPSWNWTLNSPIFLGTSGLLTQTRPVVGFSLVVGYPLSSTRMMVDIKIPILL